MHFLSHLQLLSIYKHNVVILQYPQDENAHEVHKILEFFYL